MKYLEILFMAIGLSMDTFSLALSIGLMSKKNNHFLLCSILVGLYHFIMPSLGSIIGHELADMLTINFDIVLGIILLIIAFSLILDKCKNKELKFNDSLIGLNIFALTVSIDAFSVGIGYAKFNPIAYIIFAITSFIFTIVGLYSGKFINKKIGSISEYIGVSILTILAFTYLFK